MESLSLESVLPNQGISIGDSGSTFLVLQKNGKTLCVEEIRGILDFEVAIIDEDTEEELNR